MLRWLPVWGSYQSDTRHAKGESGVPRRSRWIRRRSGKLSQPARGAAAFEVKASGDGSAVEYLPCHPVLVSRLSRRSTRSPSPNSSGYSPTVTATPQVRAYPRPRRQNRPCSTAPDVVNGSNMSYSFPHGARNGMSSRSAPRRGPPVGDMVRAHVREVGTKIRPLLPATYAHTRGVAGQPRLPDVHRGRRPREAVVGGLTDINAWGVYTDNPAVVLLAIEYIRHDIAIQLMGEHFDAAEVDRFWKSDPDLERLVPITASRPN